MKIKAKLYSCFRTNLLTILTVAGVIAGVVIGIVLRGTTEKWTNRDVMYIQFVGDIFLRMLKALILPLIISSLVAAIGGLDLTLSGKIGGRAVTYYLITTVMAVILGLILVSVIKPGANRSDDGFTNTGSDTETRNVTTADTLLDLVRNMFPPNLVQACVQQYQTVLEPPVTHDEPDITKWNVKGEFVDGMNILGLVVASCVFGVAISAVKKEGELILKFFIDLSQIMMRITRWIIWLSPVGVLFLICAKFLEMDDIEQVIGQLGLYFATVLVGILFHGFFILPLIYFAFTRRNPYRFVLNMGQAMATAFGTSSSSATLPVTIQCLEENNKVDTRVSRFVLPIGATINMDGTALYEAVAAVFIAQIRGIPLTFGNLVAISITATAASIGAAGIPQAGLVTMVMVLDTIGLPAEDVSLIIAVDWLLDRFRTVINILGDSFGAGIVEHLSAKELMEQDAHKSTTVDGIENSQVTQIPMMSNENDMNL